MFGWNNDKSLLEGSILMNNEKSYSQGSLPFEIRVLRNPLDTLKQKAVPEQGQAAWLLSMGVDSELLTEHADIVKMALNTVTNDFERLIYLLLNILPAITELILP